MSAVKYLEDSYNKEEAAHFPILDLPLSNRISSSERLPDIFFTSPFQAVTGKEEQMKESLTLDWLHETIIIKPDSFPMLAVKYLEDSCNKEEAAHFPILDLPLSNRISSSERLSHIFFTSPFQAVPGKPNAGLAAVNDSPSDNEINRR
ncbi:hypothetical protein CDAR_25761 [Caerostris darwini]|uniref:Uncharacterized protein n=1 Tax=Caerostris darwini TaxID=1538125 RepID=A0AAV4NKD6_9ARAC|nr:hypothetical protein CDAR_25761 [Caerostris darwini]